MIRKKLCVCGISRASVLNGVGGEEILFCRLPSTIYNIMFLRSLGTFLLFGFPVYGFTVLLNKLEKQNVNFSLKA